MFYFNPDLNTVKNMLKRIYLLLVLAAALACKATPPKPIKVIGSSDIHPDTKQSIVCQTVAKFISELNYKKININDSISEVIYNRYLKILDEGHNYFLASDITDFNKH